MEVKRLRRASWGWWGCRVATCDTLVVFLILRALGLSPRSHASPAGSRRDTSGADEGAQITGALTIARCGYIPRGERTRIASSSPRLLVRMTTTIPADHLLKSFSRPTLLGTWSDTNPSLEANANRHASTSKRRSKHSCRIQLPLPRHRHSVCPGKSRSTTRSSRANPFASS